MTSAPANVKVSIFLKRRMPVICMILCISLTFILLASDDYGLMKPLTKHFDNALKSEQSLAIVISDDFFTKKKQFSYIHIPKSGGASWVHEFQLENTPKCYNSLRGDGTMMAVLIRSPRSHLRSQFGECSFDTWGKKVTENTDFPRTGDVEADYASWIHHFHSALPNQLGPEFDFKCYDPRDVQTRFMSCNRPRNHVANHALNPWPRLDVALINLMDADFVGITDFYSESACIYGYRRNQVMLDGCFCDSTHVANHTHKTHNVPAGHSNAAVEHDLLRKVDELTKLDVILFMAALQRFLYDVAVAEKVAGRQIMCNDKHEKAQQLTQEYSETDACREFGGCENLFESFAKLPALKSSKTYRHIRSS